MSPARITARPASPRPAPANGSPPTDPASIPLSRGNFDQHNESLAQKIEARGAQKSWCKTKEQRARQSRFWHELNGRYPAKTISGAWLRHRGPAKRKKRLIRAIRTHIGHSTPPLIRGIAIPGTAYHSNKSFDCFDRLTESPKRSLLATIIRHAI
jgi:hypothetical protein